MPAQMRRTGRPLLAIAQQEQRRAAFNRAQAEAAADREIEQFGGAPDIGDNAGNRPAGQGFLGHPEHFAHVVGPHDDHLRRIQAKGGETRPIGQAEKLRILVQLQVKHRHAPGRQQRLRLAQGKTEARPAIADRIGEHFLHQPSR
jgi:hypothetical protein